MKIEKLRELENLVDEELKVADVFKFPINKKDIRRVRAYFSDTDDLNVIIESSYPTNIEKLSEKYLAVFSKHEGVHTNKNQGFSIVRSNSANEGAYT